VVEIGISIKKNKLFFIINEKIFCASYLSLNFKNINKNVIILKWPNQNK